VTAKRDIRDITYDGQNISPTDVSKIQAGHDIVMQYATKTSKDLYDDAITPVIPGLVQGGPGVFMVQAGGSIDLGTLEGGIQTIGNGQYPQLGTGKSTLAVIAGYKYYEEPGATYTKFDKTAEQLKTFFDEVRDKGDEYATLLAKGKASDAAKLLAETRTDIYGFLGTASGAGNINMTSSQIATSIGQSDIFIIANGAMNMGKTALPSSGTVSKKTGITTGSGGTINIYAQGDVNVNESRIMTFFSRDDVRKKLDGFGLGSLTEDVVTALLKAKEDSNPNNTVFEDELRKKGITIVGDTWDKLMAINKEVRLMGDITVWSDKGSINAGRGSRTAVSASPPRIDELTGQQVFTPPAIGSGLRAATYGDNAPIPGNIHLTTPEGAIDAGEAEIAGGRIFLAALEVRNVGNINGAGPSVGGVQSGAGTTNIGSLSGGNMAQSSMSSDAAGLGAKMQASQMLDDIMAKWLEVKVVDFVEE
jgi:hypothetical protein